MHYARLICTALLASAFCHAQNPVATNDVPLTIRYVYNGFERSPDGRLAYVFVSQDLGQTNTLFMGESIGGYQLLGFAADTRKLTLGGSNGSQTLLGAGEGFSYTVTPTKRPVAPTPGVVKNDANEIHNKSYDLQYQATTSDSLLAFPSLEERNRGRGTVQQNSFFFGDEFLYPTSFEVKSFPVPLRDGKVQYYYPVVIPHNFRRGGRGVYGTRE